MPHQPDPIASSVCHRSWYASDQALLAHTSATTVAARRRTPPPASVRRNSATGETTRWAAGRTRRLTRGARPAPIGRQDQRSAPTR